MLLLVQYTLIFASVLVLVALGGCFSEHSGVINLGLEGIMVIGALGGALVMRALEGHTSGVLLVLAVLLGAIVFGVAYSALLGVASINFQADQTLVGTAMNLLGTAGATVFVKALNTAANPDDVSSTVQYVEAKKSFLLNINGFEFNWFMLIAVLAVVVAYITLYKTRFGLRLMACGEHPQAAASVGISVCKMRWAGVLISGVLGGTLRHVVDIILPRVLAQKRARFRVREVLAVPERRIRDAPVQDGKVARHIQRSVGRDINAGRARRDEQHKMRGVRDLRNADVRKTMALDRERPRGHDNGFRHVRLRHKQ